MIKCCQISSGTSECAQVIVARIQKHGSPVKLKHLHTIGYEGVSLDAFLATLTAAKVTTLLDVRELAISRRKGFSKSALAAALQSVGIVYRHERALGTPREMRHRLRRDGNYKRYFADFREYLGTQKRLIADLAGELTGRVTLLCFERNPTECHRSIVVGELAKRSGVDFSHLFVGEAIDDQRGRSRPRDSSSSSTSAADSVGENFRAATIPAVRAGLTRPRIHSGRLARSRTTSSVR